MMFAAVVGHCCGRATPFLRNAPQRQSMEIVRGETIYRNRNAVQTNPATSVISSSSRFCRVRKLCYSFSKMRDISRFDGDALHQAAGHGSRFRQG
jgi:hypothetical protein